MSYNPKELGVEQVVPWRYRPVAGTNLRGPVIVSGQGFKFAAGLLLPVGARTTAGRFDDTDIVHVVREGFGLLMPKSERARFTPGAQIGPVQLLPCVEAGATSRAAGQPARGWQVNGAVVKSAQERSFDFEVWNQPLRGIIAVLIGL